MKTERGGLILGLMVGVLVGLALALVVALYVTKAPVPFVNKVPPRTADQDAAEMERNKNWDPNAALAARGARVTDAASAVAPSEAPRAPTVIAPPGTRDPAAILAGAPVAPSPAAPTPPANRPSPATSHADAPSAADESRAAPAAVSPVVVAPPAPPSKEANVSAKSGGDTLIYFVQAGAFQGSSEAEQQKAKLAMLGVEAKVIEREQSGRTVFRVRSGPYTKLADAEGAKAKLAEAGVDALLVRVDPRQP